MICPELVGRDSELARLADLFSGGSGGGVTALIGDAGVGKSRLLAEATRGSDAQVLAGRAVPSGRPVPYRPLTEAFLAAFRGQPIPVQPLLHGFEGQLGRLIPIWRTSDPADDSPLLLGEATVRLLTVLGEQHPVVLVLEDLHWADTETISVVEYLADALTETGGRCVVTTRADDASRDLIERLQRRHAASLIRLDELDDEAVTAMVAACLDVATPPAGVVDFLQRHTDGTPLLVEELLAGVIATGALRKVDRHWEVVSLLTVDVPASLRDSVSRRLALLDPTHRRVIGAAALLGRSFAWELLPGIALVDGRTTIEALRAAVDAQLLEASGDDFGFRHALSREAVIADLIPPERIELAARALPAVERAHPGLPGQTCELAADLAQASGVPAAASALLVVSARRALASGAFVTAEGTARRAGELADEAGVARLDPDEVLVQVLAAAGKPLDSLAVGEPLAARMTAVDAPAQRRVELLVGLVRAGIAGGDLAAADRAAEAAAAAAGTAAGAAMLALIDAVTAELALERNENDRAALLSRRAIEAAEATDQPELLCEALIVLGRAQRPDGHHLSRQSFQRCSDIAEANGLTRWHLLARRELSLLDFATSGPQLLRDTRELAARYGAHTTVAAMDLALADFGLSNFDRETAWSSALACVDASTRYGLASESVAQLWLAGAHALRSDEPGMSAAIDAALAQDPDDQRILGDLYGRVLLTRAFVEDELDSLPGLLEIMIEHVRRAPHTKSVYPGRVTWALLHTLRDDDRGAAARLEYTESATRVGMPLFVHYGDMIDAVARWRAGDAEQATEAFETATRNIRSHVAGIGMLRTCQLLIARTAVSEGWGDPVSWSRDAEAFFAAGGYPKLVRRARSLLGDAGVPVPRKGRGESDVPPGLRALGVTSREVDVLKLVIDGRSNREIADALYLSQKTVERHLSSLFVRTGVSNRRALAEVGVTHFS